MRYVPAKIHLEIIFDQRDWDQLCSLSKVKYLGNNFAQLQVSCYYDSAHIKVENVLGLLATSILGNQPSQGTVILRKIGVRKSFRIRDNRRT